MVTAEELITENIDLWTGAIKHKSSAGRGRGKGSSKKIELYGVKKLRELILEMAVRGLLVPQSPNDEPASVLLERIAVEKAELIKTKAIKKPKVLSAITEAEKPTKLLPFGWQFVRLNDLGEWGAGATPSRRNPELYGGDIPWFKSGELASDYISVSEESVTESALKKSSLRYNKIGDVLLAMYGATIGKTSILSVPATTNQAVCACTPFTGFDNVFLLTLLKAYRPRFTGMGAGGAQPNISREKIISTVVALPPTAEQHRIVAKVDELMALCDQLEQQTEANISAHQTLVETLLAAITRSDSSTGTNPAESIELLFANFDSLFTTEDSIDQLKQAILQLAVMGKLVPQDPRDEPASMLLEKIAADKEKLVKEKKIKKQKIKKQKALPPIGDEEKPFELPMGWEWARVGNIYNFLNGFAFKSSWFSEDGIRLLRNINVGHGDIRWENAVSIPFSVAAEYDRFQLSMGDIVITLDRPLINTGLKYAIIKKDDLPCLLLQRVAKFNSIGDFVTTDFLSRWLESNTFTESIDPGRSNGVPHISTRQLEMGIFPICSIEEQHRIVAKVDELMVLCESLRNRLDDSNRATVQLSDLLSLKLFGHEVQPMDLDKEKEIDMKISTQLSLGHVAPDKTAVIAPIILAEGSQADARATWSKSKLDIPEFYKQLKKEILAGFIAKPSSANFE